MDEVVQAATVIAAFLFFLGIFNSSCQEHHELLCDSINTIGVLTIHCFILLDTLFLQVHQEHSGCFNCWLGPFKLLQGEETSQPWVWWCYWLFGFGIVPWSPLSLLPLWPIDSQNKSFAVGWP